MNFEFATARRIIFGAGSINKIGAISADIGGRALVVSGVDLERVQPLLKKLESAGIMVTLYVVDKEPSVEIVQKGLKLAREKNVELVIGLGGGSAMDTGKAIAGLLPNPGDVIDYLEVIGHGNQLTEPSLPYIAIPTTAGTGAEVTKNAVISSKRDQVKVSLRSPFMLPKIALIDPELTYSLPPEITASTGLDALTQLIEPYVSIRANPFTDAICKEGMKVAAQSLENAYNDGKNRNAREGMSLASLFGGLALANSGLGAVHGFAGPLGGMCPVPHGVICARLLPLVMEVNFRALNQRELGNPVLKRFDEVAQILTGDISSRAPDGVQWIDSLCERLSVPRLSDYGLTNEELPELVERAKKASSMKGNPITLTDGEMREILERAL